MEFQLVIEIEAIFTVVCLKFQMNVFNVLAFIRRIVCRVFDLRSFDGHELLTNRNVTHMCSWNLWKSNAQ